VGEVLSQDPKIKVSSADFYHRALRGLYHEAPKDGIFGRYILNNILSFGRGMSTHERASLIETGNSMEFSGGLKNYFEEIKAALLKVNIDEVIDQRSWRGKGENINRLL